MGLDVYLEKCDNLSETKKLEKQYQEESEKNWASTGKKWEETPEAERDAISKKNEEIALSLGLSEWGKSEARESINLDSKLYPKHMFKIGYFRSSYNEGGINSFLRRNGLPDLYYVFNVNDDYEPDNDWNGCLKRCNEVISKMEEYMKTDISKFDVMQIRELGSVENETEAKKLFMKELDRQLNSGCRSYSSSQGTFYLDGIKCHGFMFGKNIIGNPCVYVVIESNDGFKWYLEALHIVRETIEYVLSQDNPEKYYLCWSA